MFLFQHQEGVDHEVNKAAQMLLYLMCMKPHWIELMLTLSTALAHLVIVHQNQLSLCQHSEFKLEVEQMQRKERKLTRTDHQSGRAKELYSNNKFLV